MSKRRNIADIEPNIGFSEFDFYDLYRSTFEKSELDRMKKLLPLHAKAVNFGLARKSMRTKLGLKSYDRPIVRGKENGIQTSFVKRGRPFSKEKKGKDLVRKELTRVRATVMEGSFGTQKEHYDLRRVKARTKQTEILYIFFGIHGKRDAAGGQNRAESTAGGLLKRKYEHRKVLSRGNYASVIENGQKIRPK